MSMHRRPPVATAVALALLMTSFAGRAADPSSSARVGDLQYGNALDPTGFAPALSESDPVGVSLLRYGLSRTPTGNLYTFPSLLDGIRLGKGWEYDGLFELGGLATFGDEDAQFFRQYNDLEDGVAAGLLWVDLWKPETGTYLEARGSYLGNDDNYFRLRGGQYGKLRAEAFFRSLPHIVSTTAHPIWEGIGGDDLTLPAGMIPGATPQADVQAASDAAPRRTIRVDRTRAGVSIEGDAGRGWVAYGALVNEQRDGTRLWGGPFFFNYPFADNGGVLETVRPIDFSTTDLSAGLRRVGKVWRFNSVYSGSFFRNHKSRLDYQNPFAITPVVPVPAAGTLSQGTFSLEPDNDAHNLKMELARSLPMQGELSFTGAYGTMRQDDALVPPVGCEGTIGIFLGPGADYTADCANWNTPAALSRLTADARIDTLLLDAKASFRPTEGFAWHAELRRYREKNKTDYTAYNPLTGEYGYISENGSQGTVVPGEMGIFDPDNPLYNGYFTKYRSLPVGYTDTTAELGGDWSLGYRNNLGATYSYRRYEPQVRERDHTDEHRIQLALTSRQFLKGTLRASYEYADRDGDSYDYFPYASYYTVSLPGFEAEEGALPFTVTAMRKYDLSNRKQNKFRAIYTLPVGETATFSGTLYGRYNKYGTVIGRKGENATGVTLAWDYQPTPRLTLNASVGAEQARLRIANVADAEGAVSSDPALGGAKYPLDNMWTESNRDRNFNGSLQFSYQWVRTRFDGGYTFVDSRGRLRYDYASLGAISGTQIPYLDELSQFPDTSYRLHSFDLGLTRTFTPRFSARIFGRYEHGSFADWHYSGFDTTLTYDHRVYTDRGPAASYDTGLVGLMLRFTP